MLLEAGAATPEQVLRALAVAERASFLQAPVQGREEPSAGGTQRPQSGDTLRGF